MGLQHLVGGLNFQTEVRDGPLLAQTHLESGCRWRAPMEGTEDRERGAPAHLGVAGDPHKACNTIIDSYAVLSIAILSNTGARECEKTSV